MDAMVFFDMGETEVCSCADFKSTVGVGTPMGSTVGKSQMHLIDPQSQRCFGPIVHTRTGGAHPY